MELSENSYNSKDLEEKNIFKIRKNLVPTKRNLAIIKGKAHFTDEEKRYMALLIKKGRRVKIKSVCDKSRNSS